MLQTVPSILARIIEQKLAEAPALARQRSELEQRAQSRPASRDFRAAIASKPVAVIAEVKKASPSRGLLAGDFDPAKIARAYQNGGAAALSILTDGPNFQGSLDHLRAARAAVSIPALRKDFTVMAEHVLEAAANGADAILLIAAILTDAELRGFRELAEEHAMDALVEVHEEDELRRALDSGARIVGVNNRDLRTFEVTLETAFRLAKLMPDSVVRVAESGIHSHADIARLKEAGYSAFLVGEHLMTSADPASALRDLLLQ